MKSEPHNLALVSSYILLVLAKLLSTRVLFCIFFLSVCRCSEFEMAEKELRLKVNSLPTLCSHDDH